MSNTRFVAAIALATTALSSGSLAYAQDAESAPTPAAEEAAKAAQAPAAQASATDENMIVVVGSRIRRDTFNAPSPIQVVTRDETTAAGFSTTTEALQGTAVTGGSQQINNSFGGFVTEGGPGANTLSLRGLGATRTLILLNGRRLAPAGTRGSVGSADLNVIPNLIVDRYEVLKDGASSVYGSDAVAGVVNIVTRTKLEGFEVEAQNNLPEVGAGSSQRLSLAWGKTGDRFNISGTLEYLQRAEMNFGDRDFTACQTDYTRTAANRTPGSANFIDPKTGQAKCYTITGTGTNGVTINTIGTNTRTGVASAGAAGTRFNRFRPNAAVTTGTVPGYEGVSLQSRDTFEPRMQLRSLISPAKVYTGYLQGGYDIGALGDGELYGEVLATRRTSSQTGYRQLSLDYEAGSILLPSFLQDSVSGFPTDITNGNFLGVRAFIGFGNDRSSQRVDYIRAGGGLRGNVTSDIRYDFYVGQSWTDATYSFQSFLTDRLSKSLNVVANGSGFACADPSGGCIAAPALTAEVVGGILPKAWTDYVFQTVTGSTKFRETTVNFGVDGTLFELPYGKMGFAAGLEFRKGKLNDTPSPEAQRRNLYNLTSSGITRGSDEVKEVYAELEIPLLANLPLAKELKINASARYTDYKSYGSDWTYKVGGIYAPTGWLSLRGSYGTSFRAPAIYEQFLGGESGFIGAANDPCNQYEADGSTVAINCAAEGLEEGFLQTSGIQVLSTGGRQLGLKAETSTNRTFGLVFEPKLPAWAGNFQLAVDMYKIVVKDQVAQFGGANILDQCYNDPQFVGGGGFCNFITRNANGGLTVVDNFVNLSFQKVRGIDFEARYTRDIGQGELRLNATVNHYMEQSSRLFPTDPLDDVNGTLNSPSWTGEFNATYKIKKMRFRYGLEWIDNMDSYAYFGLDRNTTPFYLEVPNYYQHSASIAYEADKFEVTVGVRNMFDKDPPQISYAAYSRIGNAPLYSGYDYSGREFFVTFGAKF